MLSIIASDFTCALTELCCFVLQIFRCLTDVHHRPTPTDTDAAAACDNCITVMVMYRSLYCYLTMLIQTLHIYNREKAAGLAAGKTVTLLLHTTNISLADGRTNAS